MKRLFVAAGAVMMSAAAVAQGTGGVVLTNPEFQGGFANRGLCTAALAKVRNAQRDDAQTRGEAYRTLSKSDFLKESLRTTRCDCPSSTAARRSAGWFWVRAPGSRASRPRIDSFWTISRIRSAWRPTLHALPTRLSDSLKTSSAHGSG